MEVYVARQPIFNNECNVMAYELLYRGSKSDQSFAGIDGDQATAEVVMNSFYNMGFKHISGQKKCFVNFTENLLKSELPFCFPQNQLVIELLENIPLTKELVHTCRMLKNKGYQIALDDFVFQMDNPYTEDLLRYADIVKVDIRQYSLDGMKVLKEQVAPYTLELLAEKVETYEEFIQCRSLGFEYYQGYFFSKPVIMTSYDTSFQPFQHIELMKELALPQPDVTNVAEKIENDVSLSYKLLKLINSVAYRRIEPIKSIVQAIMLLGFDEVKKWSYVLMLKEMGAKADSAPYEVMKLCYIRARLCERVSFLVGEDRESSSFFLTGMLSFINVFLQRPMEESIEDLPLHHDIKDALTGVSNPYGHALELCKSIEVADWEGIGDLCLSLSVDQGTLFIEYRQAIEWAQDLLMVYEEYSHS
ncbi:HDOD domain-containing protein [Pontibacillus sp. ALD_SL1]|uniref:EAL and HDOD domain-containing protein n=1 Tax=Pontibacillus sp. ALD_SL1 TaxID=2777185 RepID=UPI001A96B1EE|nr:HDOD domain-containing protein [Pontibacillus sp. ALD_SL1]QSS99939.1 HDOD domain-containing protein [Pontibacillus sp. ALD_SL1]